MSEKDDLITTGELLAGEIKVFEAEPMDWTEMAKRGRAAILHLNKVQSQPSPSFYADDSDNSDAPAAGTSSTQRRASLQVSSENPQAEHEAHNGSLVIVSLPKLKAPPRIKWWKKDAERDLDAPERPRTISNSDKPAIQIWEKEQAARELREINQHLGLKVDCQKDPFFKDETEETGVH